MKYLTTPMVLFASMVGATSRAEDWQQFRGVNSSGVSSATLPTKWNETENLLWKVDVPGEGWSAPIVTSGKVILTTAVGNGGRDSDYEWRIYCFDEKTGKELWMQTAIEGKPRLGKHRDNTYASETPVTDGKSIVAYFGMMGLVCCDLDGKLLWKKDLGAYKMQNEWGTSSSPAMHDGRVFVQIDNEDDSFIVALNASNGEELWRKPRDEGSNWGSPMVWQNKLRTELVTNGRAVRSYDPATGNLLWEMSLSGSSANTTPAGFDDVLIVGTGGRNGRSICAIEAGADGKLEPGSKGVLWKNDSTGAEMSSPLMVDGLIYLLGRRGGQLTVLNAKTGQVAYQDRLPNATEFWASPYFANGKIYCPDAAGSTYVIEPGDSLKVVETNTLPASDGARFWASAAVGDNTLLIRSTSTLFAVAAKP